MFGTREAFEYLECSACGALGLLDPPSDPSEYYPEGYYSFARLEPADDVSRGAELARRVVVDLALRSTVAARVAAGFVTLPDWVAWLRGSATTSSAVLDFGCGSGGVLLSLRRNGFRRLAGYEPYGPGTVDYRNGVTIVDTLSSLARPRFDVVFLNHAFEHLPDPDRGLEEILPLLDREGSLVLRMPFADSFAWHTYRGDWVQLDAPRHVVLHTAASIRILGERHGLEVVRAYRDSTARQFTGSEQYRRDIPLRDPRAASLFSADEVAEFGRQAAVLNAAGDGDQGLVALRRRRG